MGYTNAGIDSPHQKHHDVRVGRPSHTNEDLCRTYSCSCAFGACTFPMLQCFICNQIIQLQYREQCTSQPSIPLHYALSFAGVQMSGLQFNRLYSFHQSSIRMQNTSLNSSLSVHWPGTDGRSRNSAVTLKLIRVTGDYSKGVLSTVNIIVQVRNCEHFGEYME